MIDDMTAGADLDADRRWREWQIHDAAGHRRAFRLRHRILFCVVAVATVWGVLQFV